jgi:hypothetical protein
MQSGTLRLPLMRSAARDDPGRGGLSPDMRERVVARVQAERTPTTSLLQAYRRDCGMNWIQIVEFSFYLVETFALPFAILVFIIERRKERYVDEEEIYQRLSDEYTNFLKLVLDNADLQLLRKHAGPGQLTEEQM